MVVLFHLELLAPCFFTWGKVRGVPDEYYLQLPMKSVPITTNIVSSKPTHHGKVFSMQHYVIKIVSDLQQVGGFFTVLRFPPPIKLTSLI